jgi:hypothetical protein
MGKGIATGRHEKVGKSACFVAIPPAAENMYGRTGSEKAK